MPSLTLFVLTLLTACKDGAGDSGLADADGDGFLAAEDCNDADPAVFPGAEELCDGVDNDCDAQVDNGATDATVWYPDSDGDGHGDLAGEVWACQAPQGHLADATDCNDRDAQISPSAPEVCNGQDDDCDGLSDDDDESVDVSTGVSWWTDEDGDGYGAGEATQSCAVPPGRSGSGNDCDDADWATYPGAPELCDGLDNSCDGQTDEGVMGTGIDCPVKSCLALSNLGETTDGSYWIDPSGADPFAAYCDLNSDGGGWTLVSWTNSTNVLLSGGLYQSEPYPGLDVCRTLDCSFGSAARASRMQALIQISTAFGSGMSTATQDSFQPLADYEYASAFDYGDLSGVTLSVDTYGECETEGAIEGVNRVLSGPKSHDGEAVWLSPELRYDDYTHSAGLEYIWSYGLSAPCEGNGSMPAVYIGTWSANNFGPYLQGAGGSRSTWVR